MSTRSCLSIGCSACCVTHPINSGSEDLIAVRNQSFEPCAHICKGGGCDIYGQHPAECQDPFQCLWKAGVLPLDQHPLNTGFVVDSHNVAPDGAVKYQWWEYRPGAYDEPNGQRALSSFVELMKRTSEPYYVVVISRTGTSFGYSRAELETGAVPKVFSHAEHYALRKM